VLWLGDPHPFDKQPAYNPIVYQLRVFGPTTTVLLLLGWALLKEYWFKQGKELFDTSDSEAASGANTLTSLMAWSSTRFYGVAVPGNAADERSPLQHE